MNKKDRDQLAAASLARLNRPDPDCTIALPLRANSAASSRQSKNRWPFAIGLKHVSSLSTIPGATCLKRRCTKTLSRSNHGAMELAS